MAVYYFFGPNSLLFGTFFGFPLIFLNFPLNALISRFSLPNPLVVPGGKFGLPLGRTCCEFCPLAAIGGSLLEPL